MASSSSSHERVRRSMSMVRLALVTSVMWRPPSGPPVRFHTSQLSIVPKQALPAAAASRAVSTFSRIDWAFVAEK